MDGIDCLRKDNERLRRELYMSKQSDYPPGHKPKPDVPYKAYQDAVDKYMDLAVEHAKVCDKYVALMCEKEEFRSRMSKKIIKSNDILQKRVRNQRRELSRLHNEIESLRNEVLRQENRTLSEKKLADDYKFVLEEGGPIKLFGLSGRFVLEERCVNKNVGNKCKHRVLDIELGKSEAMGSLIDFLLSHERDICYSINDYGELDIVFKSVIGRSPVDLFGGTV